MIRNKVGEESFRPHTSRPARPTNRPRLFSSAPHCQPKLRYKEPRSERFPYTSFLPPGSDFGPLLHAYTDIIVLVVAEILASTLNSLCWWIGHQTYWGVFVWTRGIYISGEFRNIPMFIPRHLRWFECSSFQTPCILTKSALKIPWSLKNPLFPL